MSKHGKMTGGTRNTIPLAISQSLQSAVRQLNSAEQELHDANEASRKRTNATVARHTKAVKSKRRAEVALKAAQKRAPGKRSTAKRYLNQY